MNGGPQSCVSNTYAGTLRGRIDTSHGRERKIMKFRGAQTSSVKLRDNVSDSLTDGPGCLTENIPWISHPNTTREGKYYTNKWINVKRKDRGVQKQYVSVSSALRLEALRFCWRVVLNKSVRRVACSIAAIILLSRYLRVVVPNNWFLFSSLESEDHRYTCQI